MKLTPRTAQRWNIWICAAAVAIAAWAWINHYDWTKNGKYASNSFPMKAFAVDATWVAVVLFTVSGVAWGIWNRRRRARERAAQVAQASDEREPVK